MTSTELFVGDDERTRQVVRVGLTAAVAGTTVAIVGSGVCGTATVESTGETVVEVPVDSGEHASGTDVGITVTVTGPGADESIESRLVVAEPGWTVHLIPHFHFDPVWWNTQAASVSEWDRRTWSTAPQLSFQKSAMAVLHDHLRLAAVDSDYCFVVAEVDYLKPFRDHHPELRAFLDELVATGRVEVVGGTWNEPDMGLPSIETLRRNFRFGLNYQHEVLGASVTTGWNLDVFGHAPQYPAVAAEAGIKAVALARGPFHQWGLLRDGPFDAMADAPRQHRSEVRWTSPGGAEVLLHSLPGHYTAGHPLDDAQTIEDAEAHVLEWLRMLRPHAATQTVIVPVGTDLAPPVRWVTEVARHFAQRYTWPRVRCSIPSAAFDDISPQSGPAQTRLRTMTRDLNPIYTGKDVTYADIKAAHTAVENLLLDAETWAALAGRGTWERNRPAIDQAWRQLVWLSHHDAVTGTCSDQVYLDLVAGWRHAWDHTRGVLVDAAGSLGRQVDLTAGPGKRRCGPAGVSVPLLVLNVDSVDREGLVTLSVDTAVLGAPGVRLVGADGRRVAMVVDHADRNASGHLVNVQITFDAPTAPGIGHVVVWLLGDDTTPTWSSAVGRTIANDSFSLTVDPDRGGAVTSFIDRTAGRELIRSGGAGGALIADTEHHTHPVFGEGPWHLLPTGERSSTADLPATVRREVSALGERLIVQGPLPDSTGPQARHHTTYLLAAGASSVSVEHRLHGQEVDNRLIRVEWPVPVEGARPICDAGEVVIGRGHGFTGADTATHPWTLDSSFATWFGLGSTVRVVVTDDDGGERRHACGAAEIVVPDRNDALASAADRLSRALIRSGVTATITDDSDARCGDLAVDTNVVDLRIVLTELDSDRRPMTRVARERLTDVQGDNIGAGTWFVTADRPLEEIWTPGMDVTGRADLPMLVVASAGADELAWIVDAIGMGLDADHEIRCTAADTRRGPGLENYSVGFASADIHSAVAEIDGTVFLNLRRSCTAWPAGQWLDPPRRSLPDGSTFAAQHWTHRVAYSIVVGEGDWRTAGFGAAARHATRPLRAFPIDGGGRRATTRQILTASGDGHVAAIERTPDGHLGVRLVSTSSVAADTVISTDTGLSAGWHSDLRFRHGAALRTEDGPVTGTRGWRVPVGPMSSTAVTLEVADAESDELVNTDSIDLSRTHPAFGRWWLQNTGPPAAGALGVSVQLRLSADGCDVLLVSDLPDEVTVDLVVTVDPVVSGPDGRFGDLPGPVAVPPRGYVCLPVRVRSDWAVPTVVTALARPRDTSSAPTEDATVLPPFTTTDLLELADASGDLGTLEPGDEGEMWVDLDWRGPVAVTAEATVVSPFGSWDIVDTPRRRLELAAAGRTRVALGYRVPASAPTGRWWAMIVVRCLDRVIYGPPVWIQVGQA